LALPIKTYYYPGMSTFEEIDKTALALKIDNTMLKPFVTIDTIKEFCEDSMKFQFMSVCINPTHVKLAARLLYGSGVQVCTVIGFPLGATTTATKVKELSVAIEEGASELEVVINIGWLKSGSFITLENEINALVDVAQGRVVSIIMETCYLNYQDKIEFCKILLNSDVAYIKTSTGFGTGGATLEDVRLIKELTRNKLKIKASGGIAHLKRVVDFLDAGADRISTSRGVGIMNELLFKR